MNVVGTDRQRYRTAILSPCANTSPALSTKHLGLCGQDVR